MIPAIHENVIAVAGFVAFLLCLLAWWKAGDYQAVSWAIISLAIGLTYSWISVIEPPDLERHWIVRLDLLAAVFNIAYWRAHYIVCKFIFEKKRTVSHAASK